MNYSLYKQAAKLIKLAGDELADTMDTVPDTTTNMGPWDTLVNGRSGDDDRINKDFDTYNTRKKLSQNKQDDNTVPDMSLFDASMTAASPYFWYHMGQGLDPAAKEALQYGGPGYAPYYSETAKNILGNTWTNAMFPPEGGAISSAKRLAGKGAGLGFTGLWALGMPAEWGDTLKKWKNLNAAPEDSTEKAAPTSSDYIEAATSTASTGMSTYALATELMKSPVFMNSMKALGVSPEKFVYWARYNPALFQIMVAQTIGEMGAAELNNGTRLKQEDYNNRQDQENVIAARNAVDPAWTDDAETRAKAQAAVQHARMITPGSLANKKSRKMLANNERPESGTEKKTRYVVAGYTPEGVPYYTPVEETVATNPNDAGTWGLTFSAAKSPTYWKNLILPLGGPLAVQARRLNHRYQPLNPEFDKEVNAAIYNRLNQNYQGVPAPRDPNAPNKVDPSSYLMIKDTDPDGDDYYRPMTLAEFTNVSSYPEEIANQPVTKNMVINRELMRALNGTANRPGEMFGALGESIVLDPGGALKQTAKGVRNAVANAAQRAGDVNYRAKQSEEEVRKSLPWYLRPFYNPSALDSM